MRVRIKKKLRVKVKRVVMSTDLVWVTGENCAQYWLCRVCNRRFRGKWYLKPKECSHG